MFESTLEKDLLPRIRPQMEKVIKETENIEARQADRKKRLANLQRKVDKLKDLYLNDLIDLEEYKRDKESYLDQIAELEAADKDLTDAITRLDSVRTDILAGKNTFDEMALYISHDKDSRNNNGNMLNEKNQSNRFEMADLPAEVGKKVNNLQPGEISEPFVMLNPKTRREQVAIVKLVKRINGHKADLADDYMIIKEMCEGAEREKIIRDWVAKKQKSVYVYIEEGWRNCEFEYDWLKEGK
jgi:peptidyl-prolyl cis-trans isomerase SurA